ncbi:MAG: MBL fold metallo-hydrolase [Deltaproteobacteria bacterium]|nr:MBL fold metallo-hydrolase [Deltaproteobacteria bacterium]
MTEVCVLASGSKGNAIYVSDGETSVLIDAGLSAIETDEHSDHIQGVGVLSRRYQLPVYINEPTLTAAKAQLGAVNETVRFHPGMDFCIGDLCLHPFSVSHDASDSVGFTVQDDTTKVGIVTDLGIATQLVRHHLKGCRLIILEANHDQRMLEEGPYPWHVKQRIQSRLGHLSNEASRDLLGEVSHSGLRYVILAHISETNNESEKALSVVGGALSNNRTELSVAYQHVAGEMINLEVD